MKLQSMSKAAFFITTICLLGSCNSDGQKQAAQQQADAIKKMVKANSPGTIPTSADGFMMTAKINGKEWKATAMYPPERAGLVVGENNGESISLPYYDRRSFLASKKRKLDGVDMRVNDDIALYTGKNGEMELTKVDEKSAEGTFYFTAKGFQSDKTLQVTEGHFRILFK